MKLTRDLLAQAEHLMLLEPKRPKQASLRRAASACYYSLFHRFTELASRSVAGRNRAQKSLVRRLFRHGEMRAAARSFSGSTLPKAVGDSLPGEIPEDLKKLAAIFVELQEQRHAADYDLQEPWTRVGVREVILRTHEAHARLDSLLEKKAAHPDRQMLRAFFLCLLLWERARKRSA